MALLRLAAGCCGSCSLFGGTTLLVSAHCAANCAAPSQIRRPALPGSICGEDVPPKRRRICDGPPKRPGGVGQRWPRRAINSFQNLPKNQKRTRLNALLVFPGLTAPGWRLPRVLGYSIPAFLAGVRGGWRIPVWPGSSFLIDRSGGRMVLF